MCFDRNINGNRDVIFLECDYLLVQRCVKLTLDMCPYFVSQKDGVDSIIYKQQVCLVLNSEKTSNCTAKIKFPKQ